MIEEKLSDVNLALHVSRDAIHGAAEQLVIAPMTVTWNSRFSSFVARSQKWDWSDIR
jgi:hypothetical protein